MRINTDTYTCAQHGDKVGGGFSRTFAFTEFALKAAKDNKEKFFEGWKTYCAANPVEKEHDWGQGDDTEAERIKKLLDESDY